MSTPTPWGKSFKPHNHNPAGTCNDPTLIVSRSLRPYALTMVLLTVGYLIVELAFNASLLDVAGQATTPEEVEHIEVFGRCVSATAVVLALFGTLLKKRFIGQSSLKCLLGKTVLMIAFVFPMVFFGERALIDFLVLNSDGAQRKNALWMTLTGGSLLRGEIELDGVRFTMGDKSRPEDKAFVALLPFWGSTVEDLTQKVKQVMPFVTRKTAVSKIGSVDQYYNEAYLKPLQQIRDIYNSKYVPGSNAYAEAINGANQRANQYWDDYVKDLAQKGYKPNTVPRFLGWAKVRRAVRERGLPVPDTWRPYDRITFHGVAVKEVRKQAGSRFSEAVRRSLGDQSTLKPGLSWAQFVKSPDVQREWKSKIGVSEKISLSAKMDPETFHKTVYLPTVKKIGKEILDRLHDPTKEYEAGGRNEKWGKDAYMAIIVPPIALGFSMLGGIVHLAKLLNYLLMLALPWKRLRLALVFGALLLLLGLPMKTSNSITTSRLVTNLNAEAAGHFHKLRAAGLVWIVKTQTVFYPINSAIRARLLGGYDFRDHSSKKQGEG